MKKTSEPTESHQTVERERRGLRVRTGVRAGYAEAEAPVYAPGPSADYPQG